LVQLGADIAARTDDGETPLKTSIRTGHHQVAQVLRELESTARTQQAAVRVWAAIAGGGALTGAIEPPPRRAGKHMHS
jgi:hypothetical protein